jgi:hypothetical protein
VGVSGFEVSGGNPEDLGLSLRKNNRCSYHKNLHMAFLYSDPIMTVNLNGDPVPFEDALDTEKEFHYLCRFLSKWNPNKQLIVKREAATHLSFTQIL